jgi:hypothetical protein
VIGTLVIGSRPGHNRAMPKAKIWTSLWIVLVVSLHGVPLLLRERPNPTTWPWLPWAMYKDSRPAGTIEADRRRLSGVTRSGQTVTVEEDSAGLSRFVVNRTFVRPWLTGDTTAAPRLFAHLNQRRRDPFVELRLSVETYIISDTGTVVRKRMLTYKPAMTSAR